MKLHALSGVDLGPEFHAMVDAIAEHVHPVGRSACVLLDDLPDTSARLDVVRLAVVVALERQAEHFQVLPLAGCYWNRVGHEWLISRIGPATPFTFVDDEPQPPERTVTLSDIGRGVRVSLHDTLIEVSPPAEQECARLLGSGVRGTPLRFPIFSSSAAAMIARGEAPDELLLWRCGLPASRHRMPGPVLAAVHESNLYFEALIAVVQIGDELVVHAEGDQNFNLVDLRVPIDFDVAEEAGNDLSPLHLDRPEKHVGRGFRFRRSGHAWRVRDHCGTISIEQSCAKAHEQDPGPVKNPVLRGPGFSSAAVREAGWTAWGPGFDDMVIPVPAGEDVVGLTKLADVPALLTREGDSVRARTADNVRTVIEFAGPVSMHDYLPWVAVQRSAHLVEIIDVATGAVLHRVNTD
ncbi:hypothetical protein [Lentzea sp. NEAU-D7]|uniref:hypothetical protein n=1 Tax=Lentzea sp. NEAU-D7 TaxID=2994667 RepID=UPI00224AF22B|nr:hypothetical protein [Lentzea sp. NEAU-D7]MCX2947487.1 hypothetical protein [Lentzea sp. NEAU-D7]